MSNVTPIRADLVPEETPRRTGAARPRNPRLTPEQQRFQNVLNSLEIGCDYVRAALANRTNAERAGRRALLADLDNEMLAEWARQTNAVTNAARMLRRNFKEAKYE